MDSRSAAIAPLSRSGRTARWPIQRRCLSGARPLRAGSPVHHHRSTCFMRPIGLFTMDRSRCSPCADPSVHVGPIWVFALDRNPRTSTNRRRNSTEYGRRVLGMATSFLPSEEVSTKPGHPQCRSVDYSLTYSYASPLPQLTLHAPALQNGVPDGHTVPQAPQLLAEVLMFVSQPFAGLWSQSAKPPLQKPMAQAPLVHAGVPLGTEQTVPQPPQLVGSVCSFTQVLLQSVEPAGHVAAHTPAVHVCPLGQAVPQPPQLVGSVCSFTQVLLQSVEPAGHVACVHTPAVHVCPL